jgi:hypothetical protein
VMETKFLGKCLEMSGNVWTRQDEVKGTLKKLHSGEFRSTVRLHSAHIFHQTLLE